MILGRMYRIRSVGSMVLGRICVIRVGIKRLVQDVRKHPNP